MPIHTIFVVCLGQIFRCKTVFNQQLSLVKYLKLGFNFNFHSIGCDFYLGTHLYGCGFFMDDFFILDIAYSNKNNNFISYMTTASNANSLVWHARLGHTGHGRMNRLARDDLLG